VAGRAFALADKEILRMATHDYVAVAADDWYQRRRRDDEGEFFRAIANQGPRKGGIDGDTRQGIYILTAGGKLLDYRNAGQNPEVMREVLTGGLNEWRALPEAERLPGAIKIDPSRTVDAAFARTPPRDGMIVNVHARALKSDESIGEFTDAACRVGAGDEASLDHMWVTEPEWRALVSSDLKAGASAAFPAGIAQRLIRFHLVDHTRGEPPFWRGDEIRRNELRLTLARIDESVAEWQLDGSVLLETRDGSRGFDASLAGRITFSRRDDRITRFDVVAVGDHWGAGPYTRRHTRPGRQPLGIAFELASGGPDLVVPPQAARNLREYFGQE
jgi:hypothetical protein